MGREELIEVLAEVLEDDPDSVDFGKEVIPSAIATHRVVSYPFEGYWSDIGTVLSFYEANLALADRNPDFNLYDESSPIYTNVRMLPPAKFQDATVVDSMIAEASVVMRATIENSVIGIRSYIADGAVLRRTVMLGADYLPWSDPSSRPGMNTPDSPGIGENSVIENAIIDKNVQVGRDCRITNADGVEDAEGEGWIIRDGVVVLRKNAVIPDGTVI